MTKTPRSKICLACPRSCPLLPQPGTDHRVQRLCPQGHVFLEQEQKEPHRHFFSTCRDDNGQLVPYRTTEPIPLREIMHIIQELRTAGSTQKRQEIHRRVRKRFKTIGS